MTVFGASARRWPLWILLAVYVAMSLQLIPWHFSDVNYAVLVEKRLVFSRTWAHVLFVPTFAFFQSFLQSLGYAGKMFLPMERVNIAAGAASLWVLFEMTDELICDPLLSAACVAVLGFDSGVIGCTIMARAHALAFLFLALAAYGLVSRRLPARVSAIVTGLSCAVAGGFDVGAFFFLPTAGIVLQSGGRDAAATQDWRRALKAFLAGLIAIYVFVAWFHGFQNWRKLFPDGGELAQFPPQSVWVQKSFWWEIRAMANLFGQLKWLLAAFAVLLAFNANRLREIREQYGKEVRAFVSMAAVSFILYALNDATNAFFYETVIFIPLMFGVLCAGRRWLRVAFIVFALHAMSSAYGDLSRSPHSSKQNPIVNEIDFLKSHLNARSTLLVPGCPYPGLAYQQYFNVVQVGSEDGLESPRNCPAAGLPYGVRLSSWISLEVSAGREVYVAEDNISPDPEDVEREISSGHNSGRIDRKKLSEAGYSLVARFISPGGKSYFLLK